MEYVKFGSQLPQAIYDKFTELDYGDKRLACAAALLWYFTTEPQVKRLYREWARAIVEDCATIENPPDTVALLLSPKNPKSRRAKKK